MSTAPDPQPQPVLRNRESAFSYRCAACNRCCHDKLIRVNPYEVARMARHLDVSTTEFLARFIAGGNALARVEREACVFLGSNGCAVHPDRPLACRLYPLGRIAGAGGAEAFVELEPHPGSEGVYGEDGTVGGYLEAQGVEPYLRAADLYYEALLQLAAALEGSGEEEQGASTAAAPAAGILDMDLAASVVAAERGQSLPSDPDLKLPLHLAYLAALAASM